MSEPLHKRIKSRKPSNIRTTAVSDRKQVGEAASKAMPVQPWTGPEGSRSLRLTDFKTVGI